MSAVLAPTPAFRKFTPKVARGLRYAIASIEFDIQHGETVEVDLGITDGDLSAAAEWLRYEIGKHGAGS